MEPAAGGGTPGGIDVDAATWSRQRRILGEGGQRKLADASAMVIGCGGLGAGAIPALVASGVGRVTLLDDDVLDASNLNRQTLFTTADLGAPKVERAAARMRELAPHCSITALWRRLTVDDAALVRGHDVVLDCTDRLASRQAISACCAGAGVPWVWAGVDGWTAVLSVFLPGGRSWEEVVGTTVDATTPPDVLGATPAVAGAWQAAEAVKLLTGVGTGLAGRLAVLDLLAGRVDLLDLA